MLPMGRTKIAVQEISVFLVLPTIAGAVELTQADLEFFSKQELGHLRG